MSEIISGSENKSRRMDPGVVKKKRGGQLHNTNALRHGFYSRQFRELELDDLAVIGSNLADEIALMRVIGRRGFELSNSPEPVSLEEYIKYMSAAGANNIRIANMLKLQSLIETPKDDNQTEISKAISEAIKELGCK